MGRYKSQNPHKKKLYHKKQARTKRRKRDIDQIHNDILAFNNQINVQYDLSLPGGGQFYCVNCARHFVDSITLNMHKKSKRLKVQLDWENTPQKSS
ncbi:unnamed protein product [Gordionus sp. m RMFG-2023]